MTSMQAPTRKQLKAELARTVPPGSEAAVLAEAAADLASAQASLASLRRARARNERAISVRERKLADWKGKIPFAGEPCADSAATALRRAGVMPCTTVADATALEPGGPDGGSRLVFRPRFRRALAGLAGFSHVWVITAGEGGVEASAHEVRALEERAGVATLAGTLADGDVVDVKPYLAYCDAVSSGEGQGDAPR